MGLPRFQAAVMVSESRAENSPDAGEDDLRAQMDAYDFRLMTMRKHAIRLQTHFTETARNCCLVSAPLTLLVA